MRSISYLYIIALIFWIIHPSDSNALKITRAIVSTDNNPLYSEFWPLVARAWKRLGVRPTLALIGDKSIKIDASIGDVIRFDPIEGVPTSLHAQVIRLLLPVYFENDACILSDIDMLPLNKHYLIDSVASFPDDCFITYRDGEYNGLGFPMCYNVAKGKIFKEIFGVNNINKDIPQLVIEWNKKGYEWFTDEKVLFEYVTHWKRYSTKCIRLGHKVFARIDRASWTYNSMDVLNNKYIDAHMLRPYSKYKKQIDDLAKLLKL